MNKTIKTLGLIVFTFFISQNLYSQFLKKIDSKDQRLSKKVFLQKKQDQGGIVPSNIIT